MKFSYNRLWKILININMMKTQLQRKLRMWANTLSNMGKGEAISLITLGKIPVFLGVSIVDIVEVIDNWEEE